MSTLLLLIGRLLAWIREASRLPLTYGRAPTEPERSLPPPPASCPSSWATAPASTERRAPDRRRRRDRRRASDPVRFELRGERVEVGYSAFAAPRNGSTNFVSGFLAFLMAWIRTNAPSVLGDVTSKPSRASDEQNFRTSSK